MEEQFYSVIGPIKVMPDLMSVSKLASIISWLNGNPFGETAFESKRDETFGFLDWSDLKMIEFGGHNGACSI